MVKPETAAGPTVIQIPWREWLLSRLGREAGVEATDMAAVTSVLQGLHTNKGMTDLGLDMLVEGKQLRVVATQCYEPGCLELAPCFPKNVRLLKESKKPKQHHHHGAALME